MSRQLSNKIIFSPAKSFSLFSSRGRLQKKIDKNQPMFFSSSEHTRRIFFFRPRSCESVLGANRQSTQTAEQTNKNAFSFVFLVLARSLSRLFVRSLSLFHVAAVLLLCVTERGLVVLDALRRTSRPRQAKQRGSLVFVVCRCRLSLCSTATSATERENEHEHEPV